MLTKNMWHEKSEFDQSWIFGHELNVDRKFKVSWCILGAHKIFWPLSGGHRTLWRVRGFDPNTRVKGSGARKTTSKGPRDCHLWYLTFTRANKDWFFLWGGVLSRWPFFQEGYIHIQPFRSSQMSSFTSTSYEAQQVQLMWWKTEDDFTEIREVSQKWEEGKTVKWTKWFCVKFKLSCV